MGYGRKILGSLVIDKIYRWAMLAAMVIELVLLATLVFLEWKR
jgi:hypothetical protein